MTAVYVLRLIPAELAGGRVVGQVEDVASGGTTYIRSAEELVGFLAGQQMSNEDGDTPCTNE